MIDIVGDVNDALVDAIKATEGVIRVRVIKK
jgi:hypothetical protein